jgi:hypothetical protein
MSCSDESERSCGDERRRTASTLKWLASSLQRPAMVMFSLTFWVLSPARPTARVGT